VIKFEIPGKPQGKARARTFYNPRLKRVQSITPEQTVCYENLIKMCFLQAKPKDFEMYQDGVHIEVKAYYRKAKGNKMLHPCLKVDVDNLVKVICDALNGLAYKDDKQVVGLVVNKVWGEPEGVIVTIGEVDPF